MATYYFKVIGGPPVTGTPVGSRTDKRKCNFMFIYSPTFKVVLWQGGFLRRYSVCSVSHVTLLGDTSCSNFCAIGQSDEYAKLHISCTGGLENQSTTLLLLGYYTIKYA